jgi:hypothetical protein
MPTVTEQNGQDYTGYSIITRGERSTQSVAAKHGDSVWRGSDGTGERETGTDPKRPWM